MITALEQAPPSEELMTRIFVATDEHHIEAVRELFSEYAASLGIDLSFQGFAEELAGLPGAYAAPRGALLLAVEGDAALGCVAVRPLEWPQIAELKRLYVRPAGRGQGLGSVLTRAALEAAHEAGYERVRLDTLPSMGTAQQLYERFGFRDIDAYRYNPIESTRYMELDLRDWARHKG